MMALCISNTGLNEGSPLGNEPVTAQTHLSVKSSAIRQAWRWMEWVVLSLFWGVLAWFPIWLALSQCGARWPEHSWHPFLEQLFPRKLREIYFLLRGQQASFPEFLPNLFKNFSLNVLVACTLQDCKRAGLLLRMWGQEVRQILTNEQ